jgi:hypothetical protein
MAPATEPVAESTTVQTPTPVEGVTVESTTTVAAPAQAPATAAVPSTALATVPAPQVPATTTNPGFQDDENISADDLVIPRLNIVQKVGEMSNVFPHGSFILDGSLVLVEGAPIKKDSKPIKLMVIGFRPKLFVERVEGGGRGQVFKTEAEVAAANGTLDWNDAEATGKTLFQRLATALVLIEQPEGVGADCFPYAIEGKNYALAQWSLKGTGYTNGAKPIMSARKIGALRNGGYRMGYWNVTTTLKQFGQNYAYIPQPKPAGPTTETFRASVKELLGF